MKTRILISGFLSIISIYPVYAGHEGGGGSNSAIDFILAAKKAIVFVSTHQEEFPEFKGYNLSELLSKASKKIVVSQEPLFVELAGGKLQEATAESLIDESGDPSITLNGSGESDYSIAKITNPIIMSALALHELAVLEKIEKTGDYHISQRFLGTNKILCNDPIGICGPAVYSTVYYEFKYDSAQYVPAEHRLHIYKPRFVSSEPLDGVTVFYLGYDTDHITKAISMGNIICKYFGTKFNIVYSVTENDLSKSKDLPYLQYKSNSQTWERGYIDARRDSNSMRYGTWLITSLGCTTDSN